MELQLQNKAQHKIADLLWVAETQQDVNSILQVFGHDARVVYEMMIAATVDEVKHTQDADKVIKALIDKF